MVLVGMPSPLLFDGTTRGCYQEVLRRASLAEAALLIHVFRHEDNPSVGRKQSQDQKL